MKYLVVVTLTLLVIFGCTNNSTKNNSALKSFKLEKAWSTDSVLKTPESALYDEKRDVIYVTNMNKNPENEEEKAFISKISTKGEIIDLIWIPGLNGPKGMAIYDDLLYASDGKDELVIIDIEKGELIDRVLYEGAQILNDVSVDLSGVVYISDSRAGVIYTYFEGEKKVWLDEGIDISNGLLCEKDRILVAGADVLSVEYDSKEITVINDSITGGDGIEEVGCGYYLVSEWPGEVYIIGPDSSITSLLNTREEKINTADIDYIKKDSLLLVPTFYKNTIDAYKLIGEFN
ncbi:hypothetical protein ACFLTE_02890 [Bacteroidota bacterium]